MIIAAHQDELAHLEARDTGKPLKQAHADAAGIARYFEFYAGAADKLHGETLPYQTGYTVLTIREPHGVTGHIVPWNYPLQIFGRSVGAALAAGNACVVKPAEDACLSILRVAELAAEAGLAGRRAEHCHGLRLRSGRGARAASGHRSHLVHRVAGNGRGWSSRWPPITTSPSRSNSAASRRKSFSPMPISTPPCPCSSRRSCRTPGKRARRAAAC